MRKTFTFLSSILLITSLLFISGFAEEKGKEEPAKKIKKEAKVKFSGDVQYRIRMNVLTGKDKEGEKIDETVDYHHVYAWNLRMKAFTSEHLMLGLRLSNPGGYETDMITDNLTWTFKGGYENIFLIVPEMYFKWKAGIVYLAGGIIPVAGNTVLDLVAFELMKDEGGDPIPYHGAGGWPWKVQMNASQIGLDLGFTFIKNNDINFGFRTMHCIATEDGKTVSPTKALKNDQLRFIFSLPLGVLENILVFNPVMHLRTNVFRSTDNEDAAHSLVGGIDIGVNPVKQVSFKLGFAMGGYSIDSSYAGSTGSTAPFGMLLSFGSVIKPGFGKAILNFNFCNAMDREADPKVVKTYLFWEAKYGIPVKGLIIMPRIRAWHSFNNIEGNDAVSTRLRPALIFIGKF